MKRSIAFYSLKCAFLITWKGYDIFGSLRLYLETIANSLTRSLARVIPEIKKYLKHVKIRNHEKNLLLQHGQLYHCWSTFRCFFCWVLIPMWIIHSPAKFGRYKFICLLIGERTTGLQISLKSQYTCAVFRVDYSKKIFRRCSNIWSFLISCKVDLSKDIFLRCSNILSHIYFLQRKLQLLFVYIYCSQVFFY